MQLTLNFPPLGKIRRVGGRENCSFIGKVYMKILLRVPVVFSSSLVLSRGNNIKVSAVFVFSFFAWWQPTSNTPLGILFDPCSFLRGIESGATIFQIVTRISCAHWEFG